MILAAGQAASEEIKLDDGTTCTVVETQTSAGDMSTTVTAGNGKVSSSTTAGNGSSTSASSSASSSAGSGSVDSYSTASVTRPDGTVITKRSDGTCSVTKPKK
nr:hypothetical protein [Rhizobium mesosinicum]